MTELSYLDAEETVLAWLLTTSVPALVDGNVSEDMLPGSKMPCVLMSRVGGGPSGRGELPEDHARISFDCWGLSKAQAKSIAKAIVSESESLGLTGGYSGSGGHLEAAETLSIVYAPSGVRARYVVDVLFVVLGSHA